ncbi:DUF6233 domain-containing protein [Streptomyces sp. NPDC050803]|uniref:DUF6233 domain-containing protein n=1 Tax=unclassified Streptomyces TaxID=2593676 RepID=UPI00341804D5
MPALPPDASRLRAILAFLDARIAENETVSIYLRLQRDAVRAALVRAEDHPTRPPKPEQPPRRPAVAPSFALNRRERSSTGYVVEQKRTPHGSEPATIHVDDCTMIEGTPHPIKAHEARVALTDPNIEPCGFCRPDSELGILD